MRDKLKFMNVMHVFLFKYVSYANSFIKCIDFKGFAVQQCHGRYA